MSLEIIESKTRKIEVCNNKIIYTLKIDNVKDYLTYTDDLFEILKNKKLKPFRDNGRLRFKYRYNGSDINFYLYDIAIACYYGKVNPDTFIQDMQNYYTYKSQHRLSIDHADNNIQNNTVHNISSMNLRTNIRKSDIISRVKEPIYLNSAYCNAKYRIQMLFKVNSNDTNKVIFKRFTGVDTPNSGGICALHFICNTPEQYVDCLKWLTEQKYEWAEPLKSGRNWNDNGNNCWCLNIDNSLHAQMILSHMNESEFQEFVCSN